MKRTYRFDVMRPGGYMIWPSRIVNTDLRIRQTALIVFRRWFGSPAVKSWHKDGFMAEVWDRRGNRVMLEQVNYQ